MYWILKKYISYCIKKKKKVTVSRSTLSKGTTITMKALTKFCTNQRIVPQYGQYTLLFFTGACRRRPQGRDWRALGVELGACRCRPPGRSRLARGRLCCQSARLQSLLLLIGAVAQVSYDCGLVHTPGEYISNFYTDRQQIYYLPGTCITMSSLFQEHSTYLPVRHMCFEVHVL